MTTGSEVLTSIAVESFKTSSSVIDALLGPKLLRLREWAAAKDAEGRVKPENAEATFGQYFRRLLKKASSLQTVAFSSRNLPLPRLYEPLILRDTFSSGTVTLDRITARGARTLLVDPAGMGKSTFSRYLVLRELCQGSLIPVLVELRRLNEGSTLLDIIRGEISGYGTLFDERLLLTWLSMGRFLVVLDGFDEVNLDRRSVATAQINALSDHCEHSAVVVTSRPQTGLSWHAGHTVANIEPLTPEQAHSLVRRYDQVAELEIGDRLASEFSSVPERFTQIPLLLVLLYRTFSFNGSVSQRVSSFYNELYEALYKGHDLTKPGYRRDRLSALDAEDFRRLVRSLGFLVVSRQIESFSSHSALSALLEDAVRLSGVRPSSLEAFIDDLLVAVPLFVQDGVDLRFVHRTVAEFFAAEFITYSHHGDRILEELLASPIRRHFGEVLAFLADLQPDLFRRYITRPLALEALTRNGEADSLTQSLSFVGRNFHVGLWRASRIHGGKRIGFPDPPAGADVYWYFHEPDLKPIGERSVLVITASYRLQPLLFACWESVSERAGFTADDLKHHDFDLDRFKSALADETWYPLFEGDQVSPEIRQAVVEMCGPALLASPFWFQGDRGTTRLEDARLVSRSAAQRVLDLIRQDEATMAWIGKLLKSS